MKDIYKLLISIIKRNGIFSSSKLKAIMKSGPATVFKKLSIAAELPDTWQTKYWKL